MRVLGNRLTLHSPSRGFSMELGSAITVLLASQYGIPVSTTMCITGATLGVALCNGDSKQLSTLWCRLMDGLLWWNSSVIQLERTGMDFFRMDSYCSYRWNHCGVLDVRQASFSWLANISALMMMMNVLGASSSMLRISEIKN